jgi:hypothetical protein
VRPPCEAAGGTWVDIGDIVPTRQDDVGQHPGVDAHRTTGAWPCSERRRPALCDFDQEHSGRNVLIHEGLAAESLLQLVELHQLHGKSSLEEAIAIELDRMSI